MTVAQARDTNPDRRFRNPGWLTYGVIRRTTASGMAVRRGRFTCQKLSSQRILTRACVCAVVGERCMYLVQWVVRQPTSDGSGINAVAVLVGLEHGNVTSSSTTFYSLAATP